jgi:translocation and assembly module TamB
MQATRSAILLHAARALLLLALFVGAFVAGLFLHANLPAMRSVIAQRAAAEVSDSIRGELRVDDLRRIGWFSVSGVDLRLLDPDGVTVVEVRGARASLRPLPLLESLIRGEGPLVVELASASVQHAAVTLDSGPDETLRLKRAVEPLTPDDPEGRPLALRIARIGAARIDVDGRPAELARVDAMDRLDVTVRRLRGSFALDERATELRVDGADLVARELPFAADLHANLGFRLALRESPSARLSLDGRFGGIPFDLEARLLDARISAALSAEVAPHAARRFLGDSAPRRAVRLRADVEGTSERIAATVRARSGESELRLKTSAVLSQDKQSFDITLEGDSLDPRVVREDLPEASLDVVGRARLTRTAAGRLRGTYRLRVEPFVLAGTPLPALRTRGELSEQALEGTLHALQEGAPTRVEYRVELAEPRELSFVVKSQIEDASALPFVGDDLSGRGALEARGTVSLDEGSIRSLVALTLRDLAAGPVRADRLEVRGRLDGPLDAPDLDATLSAERLNVAGRDVDDAELTLRGPARAPRFSLRADPRDAPEITAVGRLRTEPRLAAEDVRVRSRHPRGTVEVRVPRVELGAEDVRLDGVTIEGAGDIELSARLSSDRLDLHAKGRKVELRRLADVLGLGRQIRAGRADFAIDLGGTPERPHGTFELSAERVAVGELTGLSLATALRFDRGLATGHVTAVAGTAGYASAYVTELDVARLASAVSLAERLDGEVELALAADIGELAALAQSGLRELRGVDDAEAEIAAYSPSGMLSVDMRLRGAGTRPELRLQGHSRGFALTLPARDERSLPLRIEDTDVEVQAETTAAGDLAVRARVLRREETLGVFAFDTEANLLDVLERRDELREALLDVPFRARATLPRTPIDGLPGFVRPPGLDGVLTLDATIDGPLTNPAVRASFELSNARPELERRAPPLDVVGSFTYADSTGHLEFSAASGRRQVASGGAAIEGPLHRRLLGLSQDVAWRADGQVSVDGLPLESVSLLADRRVSGSLHGDAKLTGLNVEPALSMDLRVDRFAIDTARFENATVDLRVDRDRLIAEARLLQRTGGAVVAVSADVAWRERAILSLDPRQDFTASVLASELDAGALLPFAGGMLTRLDGRLNADLRLSRRAGRDRFGGSLSLRDGIVQIPTIGQRLRNVTIDVRATPDGNVTIERVEAQGIAGRIEAKGTAFLDGLALVRLDSSLRIPERERMELTVEGVSMGSAWGDATLVVEPRPGNQIDVSLQTQRFHVELPELATRELQSLDPDPFIDIGVARPTGFVMLPLQPVEKGRGEDDPVYNVNVDLRNVTLAQGQEMRARVRGTVLVVIADAEPTATGRIEIAEGHVDVLGRRFALEQGYASFDGQALGNPLVVATAAWDSGEGYRVLADFRGPLETGELSLRAEPPLGESEILSLLVLGTPDAVLGADPAAGAPGAGAAVAVAGAAATEGLNRALADLTDLEVTARIATEETASPRPEVAVRLGPRVTAVVGYTVGQPGVGQRPDRATLRIEYQLRRRWSLEASVGDQGSSVIDLTWRYRY